MNQNDPKYVELIYNMNAFLKSTKQYLDRLREMKKHGKDIHSEVDNLRKLCRNVSAEYSGVGWAAYDIERGAWEVN